MNIQSCFSHINLPVSGKCRLPEHQWAIPSCNLQASGPDLSNPAVGLDDALRIRRMNSKIWVFEPFMSHDVTCMFAWFAWFACHLSHLPKKSHLKCWLREAAIAQLLLVLPPGPCQWIPALRARVPLVVCTHSFDQFPAHVRHVPARSKSKKKVQAWQRADSCYSYHYS